MNIWMTADTHFSHTNIAGPKVSKWKDGYRNFDTVQDMNSTLIKNINDCVKEDDILFHLGDFNFGSEYNMLSFRKALICKEIHLILGNHDNIFDEDKRYKLKRLSFDPYSLFKTVRDTYSGYIGKNYFHLSHYSHRVWPKSHRGSIHLYGHSHASIPDFSRSMDVGVDAHPDFRPFHIDEIIKKMDQIEIVRVDHHE